MARVNVELKAFDRAPEATVWDARTGAELLALTGHTDSVLCAAFSPDGTRIVTGSADGTAKVWSAGSGAPRFEVGGEARTMASASTTTAPRSAKRAETDDFPDPIPPVSPISSIPAP